MFTNLVNKSRKVTKKTKHGASKKGFKHSHKPSKGQLNHLKFIANK
jgi:hypothetical protein